MERPILFNTEMVRAILDGKKTQTRKIIKPPFEVHEEGDRVYFTKPKQFKGEYCRFFPYDPPCDVGDVLWVRETWGYYQPEYVEAPWFVYRADFPIIQDGIQWDEPKWRPSIHMPKEVARLFLKVKNVRAGLLQDISEEDAKAEGFKIGDQPSGGNSTPALTAKQSFMWTWQRLYDKGDYPWAINPWVWVIEFERVKE